MSLVFLTLLLLVGWLVGSGNESNVCNCYLSFGYSLQQCISQPQKWCCGGSAGGCESECRERQWWLGVGSGYRRQGDVVVVAMVMMGIVDLG